MNQETPGYDCFLLTSFGGPEAPEDVMPFLENVTRGRGVPRARLEEVSHHYLALGGTSPINDQNRALIQALQSEFDARSIALPIYWGNRNWSPFLAETMRRIRADGHRRALAFATSAYSSYSGCRQYREDLAAALLETGLDGELQVDKIRVYFDHRGFIDPFAQHLAAALDEFAREGVPAEHTRVFFTTHSIPLTMAAASGPPGRFDDNGAYVAQHVAAIERVVEGAERRGAQMPGWQLVYQSRSGSPHVPWLEPDINVALRAAAAAGAKAAVIVPIGFISDHVEVVWDLDHEARDTCNDLGMEMIRVATPGTHPAFVSGIADLVEERLGTRPPVAMSDLRQWPDLCSAGCCANPRVDLPAVPGAGTARTPTLGTRT